MAGSKNMLRQIVEYLHRTTHIEVEKLKTAIAAGFGIALIVLAVGMVKLTTDRMLINESKSSAAEWARYVVSSLEDLPAILTGAAPSQNSVEFLRTANKFGKVFGYKFFGADGTPRLVVDRDLKLSRPEPSTNPVKQEFAEQLLRGQMVIGIMGAKRKNLPQVYSEAFVPVFEEAVFKGAVKVYVDLTAKTANFHGSFFWIGFVGACLIALAFGAPAYFWSKIRAQQRLDEKTWFLAHHDSLTGIPNRSNFISSLEKSIATAGQREQKLGVLFLDFDGFKEINDQFGHDMGDQLLVEVSKRLNASVGDRGYIARLGGDEFGVVIEKFETENEIVECCREMIEFISAPMHLAAHRISVGCSIGIALYPDHGEQHGELLTHADLAMYRAKSLERGTCCLFDRTMADELHARRAVEQELRHSLDSASLEIYYQPIMSAGDERRLSGFEALARMRKRDGELLSPDIFIPIAEDLGLIDKLGELMVEKACRSAVNWPDGLKLSVNLSPKQFESGAFPDTLRHILRSTGFRPDLLVCEVTERLLLQNDDHVLPQIGALQAMGVQTSVDDFGAGYSSLSYLWKFKFDQLKIDRSLTERLDSDPGAIDIARTVVGLAHSLGMGVTTEGIENAEQLKIAQSFKCDFLQGYFLSKPIPEIDVPAFIMGGRLPQAQHRNSTFSQLSKVG